MPAQDETGTTGPRLKRKIRRTTRACDFCHRRGIRCRPSSSDKEQCQNCVDFDEPCTYHRPAKRRGIPKNDNRVSSPAGVSCDRPGQVGDDSDTGALESWKSPLVPEASVVDSLVDIYFEIVYPM